MKIPTPGGATPIVDAFLFRSMPIRRKFQIFAAGVSFWFIMIAVTGGIAAGSTVERAIILVALVQAHLLLAVFATSLTHSLTDPIGVMIGQTRALTRGEFDASEQIVVGDDDELGEFSMEDDSAAMIYERLSEMFEDFGLPLHRVFEVDADGARMTVAECVQDAGPWCGTALLFDSDLCRARRTGAEVSSFVYHGVCNQFTWDDKNHICLPLTVGGNIGGVVQLVFAEDAATQDIRTRVEKVKRYLNEAVPVLEAKRLNERLRESAVRDASTGTFNRRLLDEYRHELLALAERREAGIGVLMMGIDRLKDVNDAFGHAAGDAVLRGLADVLRRALRAGDLLVRYGGDEMLVLLLNGEPSSPAEVAERVREAVAGHQFLFQGASIGVTVSIGVASWSAGSEDLRDVIDRADASMYDAKAAGRNRVHAVAERLAMSA